MKKLKYRGVVYDVGLQYNLGNYSVETFNPELVKYDMSVIVNELHANTVRIEGEDISRLVRATEIAHAAGLKVFFNPWKMGANDDETKKKVFAQFPVIKEVVFNKPSNIS